MKYKINSYKVGFFTVLQSNLQLHKNEEHLNQPSFTSRVKFKTLKIEHTSNSPPPPRKKTKQNKTKLNDLSLVYVRFQSKGSFTKGRKSGVDFIVM